MAKRTPPVHPAARRQIAALGQRLRAARLRRRLSQQALGDRVGVSKQTIAKLEAGNPSTSLATTIRALVMLGFDKDLDRLASEDPLGQALQDSRLTRPPPRRGGGTAP